MARAAPDQPPAGAIQVDAKRVAVDQASLDFAHASGDLACYDSAIEALLTGAGFLHGRHIVDCTRERSHLVLSEADHGVEAAGALATAAAHDRHRVRIDGLRLTAGSPLIGGCDINDAFIDVHQYRRWQCESGERQHVGMCAQREKPVHPCTG